MSEHDQTSEAPTGAVPPAEISVVISTPRHEARVRAVDEQDDRPLTHRRVRVDFGDVALFMTAAAAKALAADLIAAAVLQEWRSPGGSAAAEIIASDIPAELVRHVTASDLTP